MKVPELDYLPDLDVLTDSVDFGTAFVEEVTIQSYLEKKGYTTLLSCLNHYQLFKYKWTSLLVPPERSLAALKDTINDDTIFQRYILCYLLPSLPIFENKLTATLSPGVSFYAWLDNDSNKKYIANVVVQGQPTNTSNGTLYALKEILPFFYATNSGMFTKVQKLGQNTLHHIFNL